MHTEGPSIEERLKDITHKQFGSAKAPITLETSFVNDLGLDSLDIVEFVMELEDTFDLNIPDEDAENLLTVGDAIKYIKEHTMESGVV